MKPKVYIDGQSGTTGLQIHERLANRSDIEVLRIDEDKRHDNDERRKMIAAADIVFLCLPDAGAREAVALAEGTNARIIDASTAHRTAPGWTYGFPELSDEQRDAIRNSSRVANPGCHATGFLSIAAPLVRTGLVPADYPFTCYSLTGYSGGGKGMIAEYEDEARDEKLSSPALYGLGLAHKHLPEMQVVAQLASAPAFLPVVDDYYKGMATTILLHNDLLNASAAMAGESVQIAEAETPAEKAAVKSPVTPDVIRAKLKEYYAGAQFVRVCDAEELPPRIYANTLAGTNRLEIYVYGNDAQTGITALFDNLGKGASGAAVQNMNIMLGLPEDTGL